jgi:hypothetical protein
LWVRIGTSTLVPPLGLAYIAGALEAHGCHVHVIDALDHGTARQLELETTLGTT